MTSRLPLLLTASLLSCLSLPAQAADPSETTGPKPSATVTQPAPVFSLGGISIAPGPQCSAAPAIPAGATARPQPARPRRSARAPRRVADPIPLRTYLRI